MKKCSPQTGLAALLALACSVIVACGSSQQAPATAAPAQQREQHAETDAEGEGHVELSEAAAKSAGVEVAVAGPATVRETLLIYGTVRPNAERVREVTARFPGLIRSVSHSVGDRVQAGGVLATIESNESLTNYTVTAPLSGVITARAANTGERAGEAPLFTVADLSSVWVELALFPRDLAKVHGGMHVRVRTPDGDLLAESRIAYVSPVGQSGSQTLTARVPIENRGGRWAPGLYVTGEVTLTELAVPVGVKTSALQRVDDRPVVFVVDGDGFRARAVVPGRADGDFVEIRSGLSAGDRYAAANSFVLKSELGKDEAEHEH